MEQFIGCDAHKTYSVFVAVNERGQASHAIRVAHDRELYRQFLERLPPGSQIALEASGHYYWIVDEMEEAGHRPRLAHPLEAKKRMMSKHSAQREILKWRELRPIDIATLYGPFLGKRRNDELFQRINEASAANIRQLSAFGVACADLGPPATQPGDSDTLRRNVRTALDKMRRQYPILDPLVTTVGVTILYLRPLKAQAIDLDNLARRFVVPIVHEELKPPATSLHAIQNVKPDAVEDEWTRKGLESS